ncbi:theronine dehydrogenase-like Zn-dependent dehydrogenase [Desulfosporosinus orientis DSM 765]|uniref:Theronine dehydrogenase-like Zn-dependent dehydrogenase n=1 Tax=Desulfosporosinus orientis (strain ATCC 19365 / DSM 765 / NCIMB 8382 / VKM B-1628 / Singapore I) TaxID=768706 RepID=G7WJA4_DESOD|nr:2,3-butanediol dehydrogenase [Desulfosporosinus orientis]AET69763.1 theronine dehydrogenase-like Zn-dependent dehydrogenase [Desulfosporosinus orientis DSM 765]
MKAAVWYGRKDVRVVDVPEPPSPGEGWVKVRVEWCGICGSDLHEYLAGPIFIPAAEPDALTGSKAPLILGHEFSGEVVEIGPGVKNVQVGDRVAPDACQVCWECYHCKRMNYSMCEKLAFTGLMTDGAFAEYVNVPAYTMYKIPDDMSYEAAAVIEPIAVGIHAVRQAPVIEGDKVVVLGAGTIGLATLQAAKAAGASRVYVIEMAKARKEYALNMGATAVFDPREVDVVAKIKELTDGLGADVTFECVGNEKTAPLAIQLARKSGKVVMVGIFERESSFNFFEVTANEKHIIGSLAYNGEFATAIDLLNDGRLSAEPMITGKIKLEDIIEKGFDELVNRKEANIKILVSPR